MPERLVDVEKQGAKVLHTFPVTISAPAVEDEAFKEQPRWPTDPIRRSAWRAGGDEGGS
jgi:hypothetical protein